MSLPNRRYALDPTGLSPNNQVVDETHVVGAVKGPNYPIAPIYGPFFNDRNTLKVFVNGVEAAYETKYHCINLVIDATSKFSGAVCEMVILHNVQEGDVVRFASYQVLGGRFQNTMTGLENLYKAFMADNRPVDWTRITGKPNTFPPAYHLHMLSDVIGWESVIVAIERLVNALTLRSVPAFEALIDWVMARVNETATEEEIRNIVNNEKLISLRRLNFAAQTLNFNALSLTVTQRLVAKGKSFRVVAKSTNFPRQERLYWSIEHETTEVADFPNVSGSFLMTDQEGGFFIPTRYFERSGIRTFRVNIRRNGPTGPVIASTVLLSLLYSWEWDFDYGALDQGLWAVPSTLRTALVQTSPESQFLIPDDTFYEISHG